MKRKGITFSVNSEEEDDSTVESLEFQEQKAAEAMKDSSSSFLAGSVGKQELKAISSSIYDFIEYEGLKSTCLNSSFIYDFEEDTGVKPMSLKSRTIHSSSVWICCDASLDFANYFSLGLERRVHSFEIPVYHMGNFSVFSGQHILIPVFSEGFASTMSCLGWLKYMVEGVRDSDTNHILPIFFGIGPSQVLEEFRSSFKDDEAIEQALIEVINNNGWLIPETVRPNEIDSHIKEVCQMVLHMRKLSLLRTGHPLVGLDQDVRGIMNSLNLEVNDVRIVAILGEDGSGKTTLARALYDELSSGFEGCSFLADIREIAAHSGDIRYLQAKLASDLLSRECEVLQSVDEGINLIRERFCHMKVLIVLDDIVESCHLEALAGQLNWFGRGSRIIITTEHIGFTPLTHHMYNARRFGNDANALEIFSWHAFTRSSRYHALSEKILRALPSNG